MSAQKPTTLQKSLITLPPTPGLFAATAFYEAITVFGPNNDYHQLGAVLQGHLCRAFFADYACWLLPDTVSILLALSENPLPFFINDPEVLDYGLQYWPVDRFVSLANTASLGPPPAIVKLMNDEPTFQWIYAIGLSHSSSSALSGVVASDSSASTQEASKTEGLIVLAYRHRKDIDGLDTHLLAEVPDLFKNVTLLLQRWVPEPTVTMLTPSQNQALANITHELRSPLNHMVTCTAMMQDGLLGPLTPKQQQYLTLIQGGADQLLGMVEDLLDWCKIGAGKFQMVYTHFSMKTLLNDLLLLLSPTFGQKKQTLHFDLADDFPDEVYGDPNRLRQVLTNLLGNAHKFAPVETTVVLKGMRHDEKTLLLSVTDEGPGIPLEEQDTVFLPFEQATATRGKNHLGTGLGLSISKTIVALHQGQLWVDSKPGCGAQFVMTIPFLQSSVDEITAT